MDQKGFSKHLINDINESVRDNLIGLASRNDNVQLIDDCTSIVRKDFRSLRDNGNVIIISGGGSGHEPQNSGYVGKGLLTASVAGDIFASPPAGKIVKVIKKIASKDKNSGGTLLIIPNYTGDRLNFGLACERAKLEGYRVETHTFGDDCTFYGDGKRVGKRGLCGIIFAHKIAGALAEEGQCLDYIKNELLDLDKKIGTFSVSLTACNIPGHGASFNIGSDEMELGLGLHGEAGLSREKICSAKKVVEMMLHQLVGPLAMTNGFHGCGSRRTAVIVNNLGGLPQFELNIIANEVISQIGKRNITIERFYCGTYVTSFDMCGVSITILDVNDRTLELLDAPCNAPAWNCRIERSYKLNTEVFFESDEMDHSLEIDYDSIDGLKIGRELYIEALRRACEELISSESYLNELDRETGDADTGTTLSTAAKSILKLLNEGKVVPSFLQLANLVETTMGGTSGAIYSLLFTNASDNIQSFQSDEKVNLFEIWVNLMKNCIDTVIKYSYAEPGDRSMIDALHAAYCALLNSGQNGKSFAKITSEMAKQTKEAAESTAFMKARVGRASYVNARRLIKPDAGAMAVSIWMNAIADTFQDMGIEV